MPEYDNTNTGALFENDKQGNPKRPDYKGSINVDGKDYWLSMWDKVGKSGKAYYSLSIQPKESGKDSQAWRDAGARLKKDVTENQQVPIIGTIEPDGTINYDEPLDIDSIPF